MTATVITRKAIHSECVRVYCETQQQRFLSSCCLFSLFFFFGFGSLSHVPTQSPLLSFFLESRREVNNAAGLVTSSLATPRGRSFPSLAALFQRKPNHKQAPQTRSNPKATTNKQKHNHNPQSQTNKEGQETKKVGTTNSVDK